MSVHDFFLNIHLELWISGLTLIVTGIITKIMNSTSKRVNKVLSDIEHSKGASKSMLHDRLFQSYNFYLRIGSITSEDMENMEFMYKEYIALGGNGTCKVLHDKVNKLPIVTATTFETLVKEKGGRLCG